MYRSWPRGNRAGSFGSVVGSVVGWWCRLNPPEKHDWVWMMSFFGTYMKWIGWGRKRSIYLAILCDLFGVIKWPFSMVKWPPTRGWKGHFESPGSVFVIVFTKIYIYFWFTYRNYVVGSIYRALNLCQKQKISRRTCVFAKKNICFLIFLCVFWQTSIILSFRIAKFNPMIANLDLWIHHPTFRGLHPCYPNETWRMGSQHLIRCLVGPWWLLEWPPKDSHSWHINGGWS